SRDRPSNSRPSSALLNPQAPGDDSFRDSDPDHFSQMNRGVSVGAGTSFSGDGNEEAVGHGRIPFGEHHSPGPVHIRVWRTHDPHRWTAARCRSPACTTTPARAKP